jgi:hypothetical protein
MTAVLSEKREPIFRLRVPRGNGIERILVRSAGSSGRKIWFWESRNPPGSEEILAEDVAVELELLVLKRPGMSVDSRVGRPLKKRWRYLARCWLCLREILGRRAGSSLPERGAVHGSIAVLTTKDRRQVEVLEASHCVLLRAFPPCLAWQVRRSERAAQ